MATDAHVPTGIDVPGCASYELYPDNTVKQLCPNTLESAKYLATRTWQDPASKGMDDSDVSPEGGENE